MKRFASWIAAAAAVASISAFALAGGASGAPSLPTINISETGSSAISVSGSGPVSGAVNIVATHSGKGQGSFQIVRLNPNEPPATALAAGFAAVQSHHGNEDALTATGDAVIVSAGAPGAVQTVLPPGNYVALNTSGNGSPPSQQFTVTQSASPAALPAAAATQASIEFGFKGPKVLHNNTTVRAENKGFLVHMIDLIGLKSKAFYPTVRRMLLAGAPQRKFRPFLNGHFVSLLDPASPGALQQFTLHTKPGFYVEACFMDTQDGREHTQLGMERLVQVKK